MASSVNQRVSKHRAAMRAAGFKQVQIWVPDNEAAGFAEEYQRQARLVALADAEDPEIDSWLEAVWLELDWEE